MDYQKQFAESFAFIGAAGFALQRGLEILDPFLIALLHGIKALLRGVLEEERYRKLAVVLGNPDADAQKAWFLNVLSFLIGMIIACAPGFKILPLVADDANNGTNVLLSALAISTGTNAINSVVKFGQYAKDARKVEVRTLPSIQITPVNPSVALNAGGIRLSAKVTGSDDTRVRWEILTLSNGGEIALYDEVSADYRPSQTGKFHIAAISLANSAARSVVLVTVI